jgi:hypothetical protein
MTAIRTSRRKGLSNSDPGMEYRLVVEHLPSMQEALGLIPNTTKWTPQKKKEGRSCQNPSAFKYVITSNKNPVSS